MDSFSLVNYLGPIDADKSAHIKLFENLARRMEWSDDEKALELQELVDAGVDITHV